MKTGIQELMGPPEEGIAESAIPLFPIVGIGASAGGLEALEQFLENVPVDSGMAYVIIQHLDPTQKGLLPELLQRISKIEVTQVKDKMPVLPDHVYVIPPNKSMSVAKGILYLSEPLETRGLRLPIDTFLCSLARDRAALSVGIILSGMGSDGSIGLRAIKENSGTALVQEPGSAKFDSMPRSAIDTVKVDIVAPVNELPGRLFDLLRLNPAVRTKMGSNGKKEMDQEEGSDFEKIISLLRTYTGNDFSLYKKNTIYRRIERRMGIHKIDEMALYLTLLRENPKEGEILFKELMIGVTHFFRDPAVWEYLKETTIPGILSRAHSGSALRAWIPGCSTGEEAYSLAIVFKEALEKARPNRPYSLQIFATDLDNEAIEEARKGVFKTTIVAEVSPERLSRFFIKGEDSYRVNAEIREMVVFASHNIIMHPPFTRLDIISCRNLLIYMDTELQNKILGLFHFSLNSGGVMVLGSAETPGVQSHLFTALEPKLKIYQCSDTGLPSQPIDFPSSFSRDKSAHFENKLPSKSIDQIKLLADQYLLQQFSPAGVLVNENGDIVYTSGRTGKYLEPAVGKANLNIFAMLREGLGGEFPVAFRKAIKSKQPVQLRNIRVGSNEGAQMIQIDIQRIERPEVLLGMIMIVFTDSPEIRAVRKTPKKGQHTPEALLQSESEHEILRIREVLQNTLEEMQSSQEELKSTNEELQSTNEELQSTNEELTTSKEEMQSMNEELQTLNAELMSKVEDFSRVDNDMKNLLNSTDIATLFLDRDLKIRRFTNQATQIFKLIKSDIGRPFTDQVSDLQYPELSADANEVLRSLVYIQKQIPTVDGRWFSVRIMPYRTSDDRIEGLVITFINISELKLMEKRCQEAELKLNQP